MQKEFDSIAVQSEVIIECCFSQLSAFRQQLGIPSGWFNFLYRRGNQIKMFPAIRNKRVPTESFSAPPTFASSLNFF